LSQTIVERLQDFDGKEVEFESVGGQPKKIREVGGQFVPPGAQAASGARGAVRTRHEGRPAARREPSGERSTASEGPRFHNPYNFVPAPPRNTQDPDLGDGKPVEHDRFHADRYTGWIRVRMKAVTPLLVPDPEKQKEKNDGHLVLPVRVDSQGQPLIPASSVRGMLRSAYEAITNSRFCRFSDAYKSRLAYRMEARQGLGLIPARISGGQIHLLTGTSRVGPNGEPQGPLYAAWLPRYDRGRVSPTAVRYENGQLPQHRDEVDCQLKLRPHHSGKFDYWVVRSIRPARESGVEKGWVHGWVCVTNANINRKHDERVFFIVPQEDEQIGPFPLTEDLKERWRQLIRNYRELHKEDLAKRKRLGQQPDQYLGHAPGQTAWSRHVYEEGYEELRDGTLCYARLSPDKTSVEALFPVAISRELYECSPWDLLDPSLRPAERIEELSPADRVWGWVRTEARHGGDDLSTAVRGRVRVGPVRCESPDAVEIFPKELPLAILSTPKPQQGRFYVAKNKEGEAQRDGLSKLEAGYSSGKGLRGRKVYPHHAGLSASHWANPLEDRTQQGPPYQEYRRPRDAKGNEQQDNQNRSILGWVKPGAEFTFDLYVENLSRVELGALLWLLRLPKDHYLRFGGGRPLGFGSVRLKVESWDLRRPQELHSWYSAWLEHTVSARPAPEEFIEAFKQSLVRAYGSGTRRFEDIPFIKAFLVACKGFTDSLPVHYPRSTPAPDPKGENFRWFVENERRQRCALPDLVSGPALRLFVS
ncbi:MAG: TIGR03986 family CRISPR-associated RAMP protein, partial [Bryobacterales bacterium]|nr:TIGR03986 family CRISPR-associated RAMP protein [Bryobacteraceae bacterium]MDW8129341.1 TIGR03986 family CRISPR-associated RAMP protein [Bryobacterales bacterium]